VPNMVTEFVGKHFQYNKEEQDMLVKINPTPTALCRSFD
jgi:hypothetical protein